MLTYKFLSHSINIQFFPILGPTAHRAYLAHSSPVGLYMAQAHGIAHGASDNLSVFPYECSRTRKTTVAKLSAFWHFKIYRSTLCVQCMYTPGNKACYDLPSHEPTADVTQ